MRALGVDLGSKRIGIAVCDDMGILATPLCVLERSGDRENDHREIARIATAERAVCVVVGLPIDLSGNVAQAAKGVSTEVSQLATVVPVPVQLHDERMTTAAVARYFRGDRKSRQKIDAAAATVILQSWLDSSQ